MSSRWPSDGYLMKYTYVPGEPPPQPPRIVSSKVYLIGSLRNPEIPKLANVLRESGYTVFDDWFAAGPEADDRWRDYEKGRGRNLQQALDGYAANHVFYFDRRHLEQADIVVLALPAGKSGHLELGWALGKGKRGYILLDSLERWDVMYRFADGVTDSVEELVEMMSVPKVGVQELWPPTPDGATWLPEGTGAVVYARTEKNGPVDFNERIDIPGKRGYQIVVTSLDPLRWSYVSVERRAA